MTLSPPPVARPRKPRLPTIADTTLGNGLRVLVARRAGIPRLEARLVVPVARGADARDAPRMRVLEDTLLSGTSTLSSRGIAEALQGMGAGLGTSIDADHLVVSGSSLSSHRVGFLRLLGEVLVDATYPGDEVAIERERIVQEIALVRSQASTIASDALQRRLWGRHPYGAGTPDPVAVARVAPSVLRRLHQDRVAPTGSLLVLVGDVSPASILADADAALGGWKAAGTPPAGSPPVMSTPSTTLLIDRPDAVQTTIRIGGSALPRSDSGWPALALAVTVFGGYFTSRLNNNIRERRGYTYGASSRVEHRPLASQLTIGTDVGREVTAAALVEIDYELGRMLALPVEQAELDAARRYLQGTLAMAIQTQSGLAGHLASIVSTGIPVSYLQDYPAALERVTVDDLLAAARRHLAPGGLTKVLVGDVVQVEPAIRPLVEVARG